MFFFEFLRVISLRGTFVFLSNNNNLTKQKLTQFRILWLKDFVVPIRE